MTQSLQLSDKYKFISKIASGSYGEVYLANDHNKHNYAAKIEGKKSNSRLKSEYEIYKKLKDNGVTSGIPKIINFIETPESNILIMQLLGKSLDDLLNDNDGIFDMGTIFKLGINIIDLLRMVHDAGFIHRDIKPNNFLIGRGSKKSNVYIMDFGLSKQYITENDTHIGIRSERSLVGTARYVSVNIHMGIEPSRRDDLESVGYMLIYFAKGKLPWQGLKKKKCDDHIKMIGNAKMTTHVTKLCNGVPDCFIEYIQYCRRLKFDEKPDYDYLIKLFINCAEKNGVKLKYCWEN